MNEYAEILLPRVPVAPGTHRTRHHLPAGETRQFGDLELTLMTSVEEETGRVQVLLHPRISGTELKPCPVQRLPVPGIRGAVLIPRAVRWSLAWGRSAPTLILELHAPAACSDEDSTDTAEGGTA